MKLSINRKGRIIKITKAMLALLLSFAFLLTGSSFAATEEFGQTTADGVKLRKQPDTDSEILAELPLNTEVEILSEASNWYRVLYQDMVGYIRQDYLFINADGTSRIAYVIEDEVKLRGGPSQSSYVVSELASGQAVKVKQLVGDWYFVTSSELSGYVHRTYLVMTKSSTISGMLLKTGMEGQEVMKLQNELSDRGFLAKVDVTGTYGAKTRTAVQEFQKAADLGSADGVAGYETLTALHDPSNKVTKANAIYTQVKGSVVLLDWFKGGNEWLAEGSYFTVTDIKTGMSFRVWRFGGWYHADCEPATANDTAIMKKISSGKWSWNRRAIWVTYRGKTVAASMHTMPHMANPIKSNNFDGHFCIHLYNSKVHETSAECPRHQACVNSAYKAGR